MTVNKNCQYQTGGFYLPLNLFSLMKHFNLLAIETSCDETAASILRGKITKQPNFKILSSVVKSQITIHKKTGGIVPEVAARAHIKHILPVTQQALQNAQLKLTDLDYITVTTGPGLIVSLIIGTEFAKALATSLNTSLLPTNHMAGHLYSIFAQDKKTNKPTKVNFPVLSIIVSGGHTMLVLLKNYKHYQILGQTVDDAAGEAFDKVAKLLNLPYPGGPEISKLALLGKTDLNFPRPMLYTKDYNFSFAGLKTAVLNYVNKLPQPITKQQKADIAMSFQNAVVDVLIKKALKACQQFKCKTISLSGGVAANRQLRNDLAQACTTHGLKFAVPEFALCTDNAQMIAIAAYFDLYNGKKPKKPSLVAPNPVWELR